MKLDKAIEILTITSKASRHPLGPDFDDALKLGIEALKTIKDMRHYPFPEGIIGLPGETPEDNGGRHEKSG